MALCRVSWTRLCCAAAANMERFKARERRALGMATTFAYLICGAVNDERAKLQEAFARKQQAYKQQAAEFFAAETVENGLEGDENVPDGVGKCDVQVTDQSTVHQVQPPPSVVHTIHNFTAISNNVEGRRRMYRRWYKKHAPALRTKPAAAHADEEACRQRLFDKMNARRKALTRK